MESTFGTSERPCFAARHVEEVEHLAGARFGDVGQPRALRRYSDHGTIETDCREVKTEYEWGFRRKID